MNVSFDTGLVIFVTDIQLLVIIATHQICANTIYKKKSCNYSYISDPFSVATEHTYKRPELQN